MLRRLLLIIAVIGGAVLVPVASAEAQYQPGQCAFILDPPVAEPGATVTAIGNGAPRGGTVQVLIDGTVVASGVASDNETGAFSITFTAPSDPGDYVVTVNCGTSTTTQIISVTQTACTFTATGSPGSTVSGSVPGYRIGTPYTLIFQSDPVKVGEGSVDADPLAFRFQIPSFAAPGAHTLTVAGTGTNGQPRVLSCPIQVTAIQTAPLPRTGSDSGMLVKAGALLLAGGGLLLLVARRSPRTA